MLTNEEIIARYGNHPGSKGHFIEIKLVEYISCDNCPANNSCGFFDRHECDGFDYAYNKIREVFAEQEETRPTADVPQEEKNDVESLYICDRRACEVCNPNCRVTKDVRHAKHFELMGQTMVEVEPKPPTYL